MNSISFDFDIAECILIKSTRCYVPKPKVLRSEVESGVVSVLTTMIAKCCLIKCITLIYAALLQQKIAKQLFIFHAKCAKNPSKKTTSRNERKLILRFKQKLYFIFLSILCLLKKNEIIYNCFVRKKQSLEKC